MGVAIHSSQHHISFIKKVFCLYIFSVFATSPLFGSETDYVPGEVLVRFKPNDNGALRNEEEKSDILASLGGGTITRNFKLVPGLSLVKLPQGISVEAALATFSSSTKIEHVQPNYIYRAFLTFPNDPRGPTPIGGEQWGLHNTGQTGGTPEADIDAPQAWDIATDSNIIVAVIDSGVDYNHPDLAANMWINPGEDFPPLGSVGPEDFNGVNDDDNYDSYGNPLIDDIYGYDFRNNDSNPMDDFHHGTHCAGIIGAVGNNGEGVTGVCWNVRIMALKFMNDMGDGTTADAIDCIEYAIAKGAKVLSNSWGAYDYDEDLELEIMYANSAGVLFVAAAGNDGFPYPSYPARYDCNNIISVMATDHNDVRSVYEIGSSNYGENSVDLGAPGSNILSCYLGGGYEYGGGTSAAAPFVAGACALVWSTNPNLIHLQIKEIIMNSVDVVPDLNDNPQYGKMCVTGGRLNLYNALAHTTSITLNKVDSIDDGNCVVPGDEITYTISYANPITDSCDPNYIGYANDVIITDFLPLEMDFNSASGPNSVYHSSSHTVTWNIGKLEPNKSDFVTLTVTVNECIRGCGAITNLCKIRGKIEGEDRTLGWASENTPVCCASCPKPPCDELVELGVGRLNLTWCPGLFAAYHEIYFGSNFNEVHDANKSDTNVYIDTVPDPCYSIDFNDLYVHTTYYWRIDEVNEPNLWRGGIWSFSTGDSLVVDDFESYDLSGGVEEVWQDYWLNGTRAEVFIDDIIARGAGQSMRYEYGNDHSPYYSDAEADVCHLPDLPNSINRDWLSIGAKSLSLLFYGKPDNPVDEQMYMALTDGDGNTAFLPYDSDMNDVKMTEWQQWNVLLQDFVDANNVNLANVASITIRFGEPDGPPGSAGEVYFDDIRLHFWRPTDFDRNEIVNFLDYAILAAAWHTDDPNISLDDDNDVDIYDLDRFCDDWLWPDSQTMTMGFGFSEPLYTYTAEPPEQPQPEPQPQYEPEAQPQDKLPRTTQELIDWLEGILTDEQIGQTIDEEGLQKMIESLKEQL